MGLNYQTKYECWDYLCQKLCDTRHDAETHYPLPDVDEVYICELCGYKSYISTGVESNCEFHK